MKIRRMKWMGLAAVIVSFGLLAGCGSLEHTKNAANTGGNKNQWEASQDIEKEAVSLSEIPEYDGEPYIEINSNEPDFTEDELTTQSFEDYSDLDELGRCGEANASIGKDLMPTEKRGSIGQVKPSGWHTVKYDIVDGKYLYNRCHLIGYQLTAENANEENLITGTRYMNVDGMLPFENMVADYVKETGNHVMYRVTPIYQGDDLVASGVHMEAMSVEDQGEDISFNVYVYNVQPGITIDYSDGDSSVSSEKNENQQSGQDKKQIEEKKDTSGQSQEKVEIRGNKNSKIYHCKGQAAYEEMEDSKNLVVFSSEQEAKDAGYRKAKR
ncbi:Competence-specific nuclease [uncultured Roseburia sp.]|uniref:DNA/RNA non-specific endonuclease n=1 Tax=Brotonthovivens ammoniilytica TaxID=2981725 RepID=A0ABT2TF76_9FIRM|nr:DNA/RNA non-specific endonuclease [Brotonthovivens ammoniilytica]MCU6760839.1 DNA/RNA non-specific endonuclease [Brotonthovivens ammoniilytica]SCI10887.1 Competence-specific nuclease [uncultured Roseburia sp.]